MKRDDALARAITKAIERARGSSVSVGVLPGAGVYPIQGDGPAPTVAQVALWNEYGTIHTPARPFFRPAFTQNKNAIDQTCAQCLKLMIFEGWTVERALSKLGFFVQTLVQNQIKSNPGPELSGTWDGGPDKQGTGYLGRKRALGQGQVRLIATGLLLRSIQFKTTLTDAAKDETVQEIKQAARQAKKVASVERARARASARVEKEANKVRREANNKAFAAHKERIRAAKKANPGRETAVRKANGQSKTKAERAAYKPPGV